MITQQSIYHLTLKAMLIPLIAAGLLHGVKLANATDHFTPALLPMERVVLSTSGVALFQQGGRVDGQVEVQIRASVSEMNDLLKSLVFWDQGQGSILRISYSGQLALERTLSGLALDLSSTPGWLELFTQLRGREVTIEKLDNEVITARVLGTDRRLVRNNEQWVEADYLNLVSEKGLETLGLEQIRRFEITNSHLQAELNKALDALAQNQQLERQQVSLYLSGEGEREVAVSYIVEAPVWKTSYRLLMTGEQGEEGARLQAWAIVENTSDQDWNEISLALISGQPLSFIEDLYQPRFIDRPVYQPSTLHSITPQVYSLARELSLREIASGEVASRSMSPPPIPAPSPAPALESVPRAGGIANIGGEDIGSHFEYRLERVTLPRHQSAMFPILDAQVDISPISIFDAQVHEAFPLQGALLHNISDKPLPEGPMTVMLEQNYVGEARIDHMPAGSERMISYAVDLNLQVQVDNQQPETQITHGKLEGGVLLLQRSHLRETTYHAINESAESRDLIILHPRRPNWQIASQEYLLGETEQHYRLKLNIHEQAKESLIVKETRVDWERLQLINLNEPQLLYWSSQGPIDSDARQLLKKASTLRQAWSRADQDVIEVQNTIERIYKEQERIRANIEVLKEDSELYVRLIGSLEVQENQLEELINKLLEAQLQANRARDAFEDYLASL